MEFSKSVGSMNSTQRADGPRSPGSPSVSNSQSPRSPALGQNKNTIGKNKNTTKTNEASSPLKMHSVGSVCSPGANPAALTPFRLLVQVTDVLI